MYSTAYHKNCFRVFLNLKTIKNMKKLFNSLKQMFSDENGNVSSKRVVGIMCSIFLCVTLYENSFSEEHIAPSVPLVETVGALAFGCLGLSSIDKFTKRKLDNKETEESI
jgi:hypothetical protein